MMPSPDYEKIARLEIELGYRKPPDTVKAVHDLLVEISDQYIDREMPPDVVAEWQLLVERFEDLRSRDDRARAEAWTLRGLRA